MPRSTIDDMLKERYEDTVLRAAVREDIAKHGTEKHILKGKLLLPSEQAAKKWLQEKLQSEQQPTEEDD